MKKHLTVLIVLTITLLPVTAQKTKDVLYLKNGSIIYGKLMEVSDNQYKIKSSDGSLFIYQTGEVDKFVNETPLFTSRKKSGFGFVLEAGLLIGIKTVEYSAPFSFNILGNFTSNTRNIFGIGSGVEYIGQAYMPLFLEYKYLFYNKKTTPFIFVRGGKLYHVNGGTVNNDIYYNPYDYVKSYEGGLSFTLGTGVSWSFEDSEAYLSFAYRNAHTSYSQKNYNSQYATYKNNLNRLEIKFGFKF